MDKKNFEGKKCWTKLFSQKKFGHFFVTDTQRDRTFLLYIDILGWSEKSESCNCQKFQAVSERRHHSEFRTVDGIEI